jgi:hypothetical protein
MRVMHRSAAGVLLDEGVGGIDDFDQRMRSTVIVHPGPHSLRIDPVQRVQSRPPDGGAAQIAPHPCLVIQRANDVSSRPIGGPGPAGVKAIALLGFGLLGTVAFARRR